MSVATEENRVNVPANTTDMSANIPARRFQNQIQKCLRLNRSPLVYRSFIQPHYSKPPHRPVSTGREKN